MAGIKDIAKLAGVSIGTVDRVLHKRGRYSEETRQTVLAAMHTLEYKPNLTARLLKRNAPCRIAVLQPRDRQDNGFWKAAGEGALRAQREYAPFNVEIIHCPFDRYKEADFHRAGQKAATCQGILLTPVIPNAAKELLMTIPEKPVVTFDTFLSETNVLQSLYQDGYTGGKTAAQIMAMSRPTTATTAVIAYESENPNIVQRVTGFCDHIQKLGFCKPDCFNISEELSSGELKKYLKSNSINFEHYDGVFIAKTGTYKYASILNSSEHKVFCIGYDLIPENIDLMKKGRVDVLISQNTPAQVFAGIKTLASHILYNRPPEEPKVYLPVDILNAANIDSYLEFNGYKVSV